jgi:hypothetical protein
MPLSVGFGTDSAMTPGCGRADALLRRRSAFSLESIDLDQAPRRRTSINMGSLFSTPRCAVLGVQPTACTCRGIENR